MPCPIRCFDLRSRASLLLVVGISVRMVSAPLLDSADLFVPICDIFLVLLLQVASPALVSMAVPHTCHLVEGIEGLEFPTDLTAFQYYSPPFCT
jgi:hypothetical protein